MSVGRPSNYSDEAVIAAAKAIEASGKEVTGYGLREELGGGNPNSLEKRYKALAGNGQEAPEVLELPQEVSDAVAGMATGLSSQLATLLSNTYAALRTTANARVDEIEASAAARIARSNKDIEDACEKLDAEIERREGLEASLEKVHAEIQQLRLQLSQQAGTLAEAKRNEETVAAHLAMCREANLDLEREAAASRAKLEQSQKVVKELEQRTGELSKQLNDANEKREAAQQDAAAKTALLARLQDAETRLQTEVSRLNTELGQRSSEAAQLVHDKTVLIEQRKQLKESHAQALDKLNTELKNREGELSELRAEIKLLKEQKKPKAP